MKLPLSIGASSCSSSHLESETVGPCKHLIASSDDHLVNPPTNPQSTASAHICSMPSHHSPHSSHSSEVNPTDSSHPPISFSFSEAMDDGPPEPSPNRVSFGFNENVAPIPATAAFNARSKRSSLYAAQSNADVTPASTPYSIRNSSLTPESAERPRTMSPARSSNSANGFRDPFNFQTQTYTLGQTSMKPSSVRCHQLPQQSHKS